MKKAYDALTAGGTFIVTETLNDDTRRRNTFGLFMSLTLLMEFGDAFDFTSSEFISWRRVSPTKIAVS